MKKHNIIIFDGLCNFCHSSVNFIINRDPNALFIFTPIQSEFAQTLIANSDIKQHNHNSLILIKQDQYFILSTAALEICKDLRGYWYLFTILKIIPSPIRDVFYKLFARYRYSLFGKRQYCELLDNANKQRFIL